MCHSYKLRFLIFLFFLIFISSSLIGQDLEQHLEAICIPTYSEPDIPFNENFTYTCSGMGDCPLVACPEIDNYCFGSKDIKAYLSRTVDMKGMWRGIWDNISGNSTGGVHDYNPDIYCQEIQMLVDLKAMFITRVNQYWGQDVAMHQYQVIWDVMENVTKDINAAYDCAGLRRPIVQAGIWETMNPTVHNVKIPLMVRNSFLTDPDYDPAIYNGAEVYFNAARMSFDGSLPIGTFVPDITKIETRMWFYFLARGYIDRGYKALWLGQNTQWGASDEAKDWKHTTEIVDKIRAYAASLGTFVILNVETGDVFRYTDEVAPFGDGQNEENLTRQLFDFAGGGLRPREIYEVDGELANVNNYKGIYNFNDQTDPYDDDVCDVEGRYDKDMYKSGDSGISLPCDVGCSVCRQLAVLTFRILVCQAMNNNA